MATISRVGGITIVVIGGLTIRTNRINRHQYNRLRKLPVLMPYDVAAVLAANISSSSA